MVGRPGSHGTAFLFCPDFCSDDPILEKDVHRQRSCGAKFAAGLLPLLALSLALPGIGYGQAASYLDFDGLTRELRSVVERSDMARMHSAGTSREGREIWVVEIANSSGKPMGERPAVLVVANLEGDHLVGSSLALEVVRYLVDGAAGNPEIQTIVNEQVVYVFPRMNPDGAEAMFASVKWNRTRNTFPFDDDNDGRTDEDGPEDLNGDGVITVMRVMDPSGAYMIDPADERLLKVADASKGETGEYAIYWEGTDSDGDGFINEDGPGGVDLNRNFQHAYPYWERDAGLHMVSEPETRALMDFVLSHRNIGAILTFGHTDNLVTPPDSRGGLASPKTLSLLAFAAGSNDDLWDVGVFGAGGGGFGRGFGGFGGFRRGGSGFRGAQPGRNNDPNSGQRPTTTFNSSDREYFNAVSEAYESITGIENVGMHREAEGAFFQFGYFQFGVPSFSTQGWGLPSTEGRGSGAARAAPAGGAQAGGGQAGGAGSSAAGEGADAQLLSAFDSLGIDAFVDWSSHSHPTLGDVEIGGFRPYVTTNPPAEQLPELGQKHGEFVAKLARMLPRVTIADTEVEVHGGGVFTVKVEVENSGYLPTSLRHGVTSRSVQPTTVRIHIPTEDLITGAAKSSTIQVLNGSHGRQDFTWVIRGRAGAEVQITVRSQKGGSDTATVTLR